MDTDRLIAFLLSTSPRTDVPPDRNDELAAAALSTALALANGADPTAQLLACGRSTTSSRRTRSPQSVPRIARGAAGKPFQRSDVPRLPPLRRRSPRAVTTRATPAPPLLKPVSLWDCEAARLQLGDRALRLCNPRHDALADVRLSSPRARSRVPVDFQNSPRAFYSKGLQRSPRRCTQQLSGGADEYWQTA